MGWHEWVNPLNNRLGYLIGLAQNRVSPLSDQKTKFEWVLIFIFLFCIGANGFLDDGSTHLATGWANGFKPMPDTRHRPYSFMDGSNPYPYPNPLTWKTFAPAPFLLFFFFFTSADCPPQHTTTLCSGHEGQLLSSHGNPRRRASRFQAVIRSDDGERLLPLLTRNDVGHKEGRRLLHAAENLPLVGAEEIGH